MPRSPAQVAGLQDAVPSQWPSNWLCHFVVTSRTFSLVLTASRGRLGAFCFNPWLDQEQSALLELPAVTKPCQGDFPCPFPPHSCFLSPPKDLHSCTRSCSARPVPCPRGQVQARGHPAAQDVVWLYCSFREECFPKTHSW